MITVTRLKSPYPYGANTYIITCGDVCAVVDPSLPYDKNLAPAKVSYILITHGHFDHILELDSWVNGTGAEVMVSEPDSGLLSEPSLNCYKQFFGTDEGYFGKFRTVREGDLLSLGGTELKVIETPGHTAGSLAYLVDGLAFVGDTVFEGGGFGRWDLPTGDRATLCSSISRIINLPPETILYCGHGKQTTVGDYKLETKLQRII